MTDRPDSLILALNQLKANLRVQIQHCERQLKVLDSFVNNTYYAAYATQIEKDNCTVTLIPMITNGLEVFKTIKWE